MLKMALTWVRVGEQRDETTVTVLGNYRGY